MKYILSFLFVGIVLFSCNKETEEDPITPVVESTVSTVSFAIDVQPIFNTSCNDNYCHGGGADGKYYDTYANVTAVPSITILGAINHSTGYEPMPKSQPKLSQGKIDTITTWINEGKLDN